MPRRALLPLRRARARASAVYRRFLLRAATRQATARRVALGWPVRAVVCWATGPSTASRHVSHCEKVGHRERECPLRGEKSGTNLFSARRSPSRRRVACRAMTSHGPHLLCLACGQYRPTLNAQRHCVHCASTPPPLQEPKSCASWRGESASVSTLLSLSLD